MDSINFAQSTLLYTLDQSLLAAQDLLAEFSKNTEFKQKIESIFGTQVDTTQARSLIQDLAESNSSVFPKIEIRLSAEINEARGAFAGENNTIYLAKEFLEENANNITEIASVLIEEIGHFIDFQLNATDTTGDEGELFSDLVRGVELSGAELQRVKEEDDSATVTIDGQTLQIEQARTTFLQLSTAPGIAIDPQGNIIINHDGVSSFLISKFSPNRTLLQQISYGGFLSVQDDGYFATIPSGGIFQLQNDGDLVFVNSNNLSLSPVFNLKSLGINTNSIFDIASGTTSNFGGLIQPSAVQTTYGDIAVLERGEQLDVFVTGKSVGTFPFVTRLRFQSGLLQDARVIAASKVTPAGGLTNTQRGIAVNNQGTVITTLPISIGDPSGIISNRYPADVPVSFNADFPEGRGATPRVQLRGSVSGADYVDIASQGITTDRAGNFYVVTNSSGSAALGSPGAGTLIVLSPTADRVLDVQSGPIASSFLDVAVNSNSSTAYVTDLRNVVHAFTLNSINPSPNSTISLILVPRRVTEDGTSKLTYSFIRTGSTANSLTVNFRVGGTATFNSDYSQRGANSFNATTGSIAFAAGADRAVLTLDPTADTTVEPDETVTITLASGNGYTIDTTSTVTGTITNDDTVSTLPTLSINDVTLSEGNSGTKLATFTVTRTGAATQPITVRYATANGTATAGNDFTATSGTLTLATNQNSRTLTVPIIGDITVETNETFFVNLTNPTNATIRDAQGVGTITNDDTASTLPTLSINDVTLSEGNSGTKLATFTVTRTGTATQPITVRYATANGTATAGSDFTATSGTLTLATNQNSRTLTVPILGDTTVEADETFFVNLTNPTNATITDTQGVGTITNDDSPVSGDGTTTRVSIASNGTQSNQDSDSPSISSDGRYVAFESEADNLVSNDTNNWQDIFVYDRQTGQTNRVSVSSNGTQSNEDSYSAAISGDGRYVAFESYASNLVSGDTNGSLDIFVNDRQTGQTSRVSVSSNGTQGNFDSFNPTISGDGRYIAFESEANNLVSGDSNLKQDIFVYDRQTSQTSRIGGNDDSYSPAISSNGRYVAFQSYADNLVSGDTNGEGDVFVNDRQTGQTSRVSISSNGIQGNDYSSSPSISNDGRYVAFSSLASNLVSGDTNGKRDVFVYDRQTGQISRVSVSSNATQGNDASGSPVISNDGRYVSFYSLANNLVSGDTNGQRDVFVYDRQTGQTSRVSISSNGTQGNDTSSSPAISSDGRYVAFDSDANNLVSGDTNLDEDIFVRDRGLVNSSANSLNILTNNTANDISVSNTGNDVLIGGISNDTLVGGAGNDSLTGGTGLDRFKFNSRTEGLDRITDFSIVDDTIEVSAAGFGGGLTANAAIRTAQFVIGSAATTTSHRFIYNSTNGALFFDQDGSNSAIAPLQIATLNTGLALTNNDIFVVA